jgi:monofunctional biosynthetic peptidoglycan transglycosylase
VARRGTPDRSGLSAVARRDRPGVKRLGRWLLRGLLVLAAVVFAVQLWFLGAVAWWSTFDPTETSFMRAERARLAQGKPAAGLRHTWVPYARISVHLKRSVIAAEDANFTEHEGVDWEAIERAYEANKKKGKMLRGGSTITQQLAKNLFLSGERSYLRKGQELVITYMIEALMSKRRILEIYLNVAEWGVGVFGCEAGARHYFGVPAAQLSPAQAARMAAMLPRPKFYDRNRGSAYLERRAGVIQRWAGDVAVP